jgi:hypothetical protein
VIGAVVALLLALFPASAGATSANASDAFDFGNPSFCAPKKPAADFGLSSLPAVHELSEKEAGKELGHPAVNVYGDWSWVMSRPEEFGYGFSEENHGGPVEVDWTVTAQLWAVDSEGATLEEVGHTGLYLETIDAAHQPHIGLRPPDRRGFYRFDLNFESGGMTIGSYSTYFKLVRPTWRPRLKLDRTIARPGQRVLSRLENLGSDPIEYGEEFSVQRREGGRWNSARELLGEGAWLLWAGGLSAGGIGRCNALRLPADTAAGRYRIVKDITRPNGGRRGKVFYVVAPFRVVAPD